MISDVMRRSSLLALLCVLAVAAVAAAPWVNATLEPAQIAVGESARLTITRLGSGMEPVTLPVVPGLEFRVVGESHRVESIHGASLNTTAVLVRVTARAAGNFAIPGITPQSQPLLLRVVSESAAVSAARSPTAADGASVAGVHLGADGSAFARLKLPKREIFVGESVPIEIEVGGRAGFVTSLNGLPVLSDADFTLNNLSRQPSRQERAIDGKPFVVLSWHSVLAAVKPGDFPLTAVVPLTVKFRTGSEQESKLDDLLGDPFMHNYFGPTVSKDIKLTSPVETIVVSALPVTDRPANFSGAVGTFRIATDLAPAHAAAGDPLTLRLRVSGTGNFDRVNSAMLEHVEQWKTYPPKSRFKAADAIGYAGEKTFEQPLIALTPGAQTLPGIAFSYFDPVTRHYETVRSPPLAVVISPSLADTALTPPQAAPPQGAIAAAAGTAGPGPTAAHATAALPGLRPDHATVAGSAESLVPLELQPRFLAIPALLTLAMACGWFGLRRESGAALRASGRAAAKAAQRALAPLETAARGGDPAQFFHAARAVLQTAFAARWQIAPDEVTDAIVADRLGSDGDEVRQLLALADESRYAGRDLSHLDFARWTSLVRRHVIGPEQP
jgi:hypothetical protein